MILGVLMRCHEPQSCTQTAAPPKKPVRLRRRLSCDYEGRARTGQPPLIQTKTTYDVDDATNKQGYRIKSHIAKRISLR